MSFFFKYECVILKLTVVLVGCNTVLMFAGNDDEMDKDGDIQLTELNGKPVQTSIGTSPLEAWSQVLIRLGLVDEFIVEAASEAVKTAKTEAEAKIAESKKKSEEAMADKEGSDANEDTESPQEEVEEGGDEEAKATEEKGEDEEPEPISEIEKELIEKVEALKQSLSELKGDDNAAAIELADARIALLGRYTCNPFGTFENSTQSHDTWMAAAVRKEKTKMGSTGNKRKIVTATDLLERNNTFYNSDIEALLEGLPGSEYCNSYLHLVNRGAASAAVSKAFLHEQQMRLKQEKKRKLKQSKQSKAQAAQQREKEIKRKRREDERDARKRAKLEEEEEKKKVRVEERLKKLEVAVKDKMFKEATLAREKVVMALAKNFGKEMARRRKAAELVSSQAIGEKEELQEFVPIVDELPPLSKVYDEDILRIWDFISTFGSFFLERDYAEKLPTLDSLQNAINALRGAKTDTTKVQAINFFTDLSVALCKPLAGGLTRMLFASLIALNPALQKDFGAAFFNEVTAAKKKGDSEVSTQTDILLPVNAMTWKEIARISFLSDALGELGNNRQEQAHILRGYRSCGHPNSKEARRLRRVEDFGIALLRQSLTDKKDELAFEESNEQPGTLIRVETPSTPACDRSSWLFYLHNIKSLKKSEGPKPFIDNLR